MYELPRLSACHHHTNSQSHSRKQRGSRGEMKKRRPRACPACTRKRRACENEERGRRAPQAAPQSGARVAWASLRAAVRGGARRRPPVAGATGGSLEIPRAAAAAATEAPASPTRPPSRLAEPARLSHGAGTLRRKAPWWRLGRCPPPPIHGWRIGIPGGRPDLAGKPPSPKASCSEGLRPRPRPRGGAAKPPVRSGCKERDSLGAPAHPAAPPREREPPAWPGRAGAGAVRSHTGPSVFMTLMYLS